MQKLVQHFSEQCRFYVPKQNISIDESLINCKEKKREEEKLCSLFKSETNVCQHLIFAVDTVWPYVMCRETREKKHKKGIMEECILFCVFYLPNCPRLAPDLKTKGCFKIKV